MTDVQTGTDAEGRPDGADRPGSASPRRVVLLGAGAVGATALLAACGNSGGGGNPNGSDFDNDPLPAGSTAAGSKGGDSGGSSALAAVADVPSGGGVIKGDYVITQPKDGVFKAFSKVCTHQGCDVSKVDAGVIVCPCHGSKFSIETGQPTNGPATRPLEETQIKVDGANIVKA